MVIDGIINPFDQDQIFVDGCLKNAIPGIATRRSPVMDNLMQVGKFPKEADLVKCMTYSNPPTVALVTGLTPEEMATGAPGGCKISQDLAHEARTKDKGSLLTNALLFGLALYGAKKYRTDYDEAKL